MIKKNNEINLYKKKIEQMDSNDIFSLKQGERVIAINFKSVDQTISDYALPCKNTDLFVRIEEKLIKQYPELKDKHIYFVNKTDIIKRFKTIDENNIKNGDILMVNDYSF